MTPDQVDHILLALAAVVTALGSLIGALVLGLRARTDARQARIAAEAVHTSISSANGGSSVRDALNRIEDSQRDIRQDIGGLRAENRADREAAEHSHQVLHERINTLSRRIHS